MKNRRSKKIHWEKVMDFSSIEPHKNFIESFCSSELNQIIKTNIEVNNTGEKSKFFEIGMAPGIYGAAFSKEYGCIPGGIEYTESGIKSIQRLYKFYNLDTSLIYHGDFFDPKIIYDEYDIVSSWGFIEHFENYKDIIKKHFDMTKKGGYVIISIPNYHFYYRTFQEFLYPGLMSKQHITKIMNEKAFKEIIESLQEEKEFEINFFGGYGTASCAQLVSQNKIMQKIIYIIDYFLSKTKICSLISKEPSSFLFIARK